MIPPTGNELMYFFAFSLCIVRGRRNQPVPPDLRKSIYHQWLLGFPTNIRHQPPSTAADYGACKLDRYLGCAAALSAPIPFQSPVLTMSLHAAEKLLDLPGGRTLAYEDGGDTTSSIVVVFLTGLLSVGTVTRIAPALQAKGVHYVAPTLPGYGNTSPPSRNVLYATTIARDMSALLNHLHPDAELELYISGGSFGTVPTQMLYGAPFDLFPQGRYIKAMLLLGAFPPFSRDKDKETGFIYTSCMTWRDYIGVGPPSRFIPFRMLQHLMKIVIKSKLTSQESAEIFLREFMFDKMGEEEREKFKAWRDRTGYEEGQLVREMATNNRRSVEKTWEGFLSTPAVLNSDWGWGVELGGLDEEHTLGRRVLIVAGSEDDATPPQWGEYLASKYPNSRFKLFSGGHIVGLFHMDEVWAEFLVD
ncbi:hypothetical protein C0991_009774 [Blastosporella zonata]|nr:hypothetical protein C0991_009774 [Blastosporella zonata]